MNKLILGILLTSFSLPASASLLRYDFFSFIGGANTYAVGTLTYNTASESFVQADITTTPSYDWQGNLAHPGGTYNQVNLLSAPSYPLTLII
jgi:hypothetical protein